MNTLFTRIVLLSTVALGALLAQGPPDPATMVQRRVESLTKLLSLTDAQASQATTIFTNAQTASQPLFTSLRTARESYQAAIKSNNATEITQAATTIGNLNGQMMAIQGKAEAAFYAILTADQQGKYDELGGGMMGPGGMGPGSMGPMGGPGMRGRRSRN